MLGRLRGRAVPTTALLAFLAIAGALPAEARRITIGCKAGSWAAVDDGTREVVAVFSGHGTFDVSGTDADDDWLTLDLAEDAGCAALPEIRFDGGVGGYDGLSVIGGGSEDIRYEVDPRVPGAGRVAIGGAGVTFSNLEPVDVSGVQDFTLTLPGANDVITIAGGFDFATGTLPAVVISGTSGGAAFESVAVRNVGSLSVNTSTVVDGNDTITVTGAGNAHGIVALTLSTGSGSDTITINGPVTVSGGMSIVSPSVTLTSGGSLTTTGPGSGIIVYAGTIDLQAGSSITATNVDLNASGTVHLGTASDVGFGLSAAELNRITASRLTIKAFGNLSLDGPIAPTGVQALVLINHNSGTISQSAGATVTVPKLALDSLEGSTFNEPNVVGSLAAVVGGVFNFRSAGSFEVAPVAQVSGITASSSVNLTANTGTVTIGALITTYTGTVTVSAPGGVKGRMGGDVDGNAAVNVTDVLYLINFLFAGGPAPI